MRDDSPAETLPFDVVDDHVHRVARVLPRNVALELVATGEPIGAVQAAACRRSAC